MDFGFPNRTYTMPTDISLYIHIPFCHTKCPYCDFNTFAGIETLIPSYIKALTKEISQWGVLLGKPNVNTVFFGGGTPSYLRGEAINSILDVASSTFQITSRAEITMEANPGDLSNEGMSSLPKLGINRLSIGVQSLDKSLLNILGRRHSVQDAFKAYSTARQVGFTNISMDFMYGLPHQTIEQWQDTLDHVLDMSPEHLSLYCLTLEDGTPMEQQVRLGELPEPDTDLAADMYLRAVDILGTAGYRHYEISNWAKPGMESLHNLTYWRNDEYLGVGPGAHSYLGGWRFHNINSPREYIRRLEKTSLPSTPFGSISAETLRQVATLEGLEAINKHLEMAETMMLGLRLEEGVSLAGFEARFDTTLPSVYGEQIQGLMSVGLLQQSGDVLYLTEHGRLLGNEVFLRFFEPA